MEVSMDTTPAQAQPQPQPQPQSQTLSPAPAPGTPRKRSLNEIDIETRGGNGSGSAAENQENSDPTGSGGGGLLDDRKEGGVDTAGAGVGTVAGIETAVRVEIPLGSIPPPNTNVNSNSNSIAEQQQGADDVDVDVDVEADTDANMTTIEDTNGTAATPASKKRKLSPASKETKQQEKEAKDRQRAEEKSKKEEEKAKREEERRAREEEKKKREAEREEEKRKREAEREEKKRVRDEERAAREEEKKKKDEEKVKKEEEKKKRDEEKVKKEEEKSKKEKAQMRLNAFFAKPKTPGVSTSTGPGGSPNKNASDATANDDTGDVVSDYNRVFPEFFLQSHTVVAPPHRFQRDSEALGVVRRSVDESLKSGHSSEPPVFRPSEVFRMIPYKRRWGKQPGSVKDILLQIQNMGDKGDAAVGTGSAGDVKLHNRRPQDLLNQVRMKSLKFGEDVRPPYQGTFTRKVPESSAQKISRNPFRRCLPDTNYDYDSEAEWEEPEEGEELDSEEEEEADDEADDDLEGFLDDDGDEDQPVDGKRRLIVGDLEPQTSGVRWQESAHTVDPVLQMYKIETISDTVTFPIDPFSTAYWQKPKLTDAGVAGNGASSERSTTLFSGSSNSATADGAPTLGGAGKAKRGFPPEQLAEFKEVVNGSDLTKMGLVEILKKRFPKVSKDVLKETLTGQATRVGSKESEKKWVCQ